MMKRTLVALAAAASLMAGLLGAPAVAEDKVITWVGCGISKKGFMQDLADAYEKKTGIKIDLAGGGATKGLRQVASKQSHLGGACRLPLVNRQNDGTVAIEGSEQALKIIPIGWDALVVITHKDNPGVESVTKDQLRDVLTGKITNWKELGAPVDRPINLYVRKGKISGVGLTLRQQLFNNTNQEFASSAKVLASSGKIEKAIEEDPDGIAVSGISSSRQRNVRILSLEGQQPTMDNLKAGNYHLYRILFLVAPPDYDSNPDLKAFVDYALSLEGQRVIQAAGTLPYRRGIGLLRTGASTEYIMALDAIDQAGQYTLGGH